MTAQHLRDLETTRRYATLLAVLLEAKATLIDQALVLHDRILPNTGPLPNGPGPFKVSTAWPDKAYVLMAVLNDLNRSKTKYVSTRPEATGPP